MVAEMVDRWLNLQTEEQIAAALGVSPHTVHNKLSDERRKQPDLALLRSLNEQLVKGSVPALDSMRSARTLAHLEKEGVVLKTKDLASAEALVTRYGGNFANAINAGEYIQRLERVEDADFAVLMAEAERLHDQVEQGMSDFAKLETQIRDKTRELGVLKNYEDLKKWLSTLDTNPQEMAEFIARNRRLHSLGFTQEAAVKFATELGKYDLPPDEAAEKLAAALQNYKTVDAAVKGLERSKKDLDKEVSDLTEDRETIRTERDSGRAQVTALGRRIISLTDTSNILNESIRKAGTDATNSMNTIVESAKAAIEEAKVSAVSRITGTGSELIPKVEDSTKAFSKAATDVQALAEQAKKDMEEAMKEALDVGKQIERLERINRTLYFISMGKGEPRDVFPIALDILRMLKKWEENLPKELMIPWLNQTIDEMDRNWERYLKK